MDAANAFEEQDLRIADLIEREGRAIVIGMNKWDVEGTTAARPASCAQEVDHWLPQIKGVPVVALSGLTGEGLDRLMQAVIDAHAVWNKRVPTAGAQSLVRGRDRPRIRRPRCRAAGSGSTTSRRPRRGRRAS